MRNSKKEPTRLEKKYAQIINPKAFIGKTKDEFMKEMEGKLPFDRDLVWEWVKANRK